VIIYNIINLLIFSFVVKVKFEKFIDLCLW